MIWKVIKIIVVVKIININISIIMIIIIMMIIIIVIIIITKFSENIYNDKSYDQNLILLTQVLQNQLFITMAKRSDSV